MSHGARVRELIRTGDQARRATLAEAISDAGSVAGAARALGISTRTAWRWIAELDLAKNSH